MLFKQKYCALEDRHSTYGIVCYSVTISWGSLVLRIDDMFYSTVILCFPDAFWCFQSTQSKENFRLLIERVSFQYFANKICSYMKQIEVEIYSLHQASPALVRTHKRVSQESWQVLYKTTLKSWVLAQRQPQLALSPKQYHRAAIAGIQVEITQGLVALKNYATVGLHFSYKANAILECIQVLVTYLGGDHVALALCPCPMNGRVLTPT